MSEQARIRKEVVPVMRVSMQRLPGIRGKPIRSKGRESPKEERSEENLIESGHIH